MPTATANPTHQINIRLEDEPHAKLVALAKRLQCPPATALRRIWEQSCNAGTEGACIVFQEPPPPLSEAQDQALIELASLGRNLNQLMHQIHLNRLNGFPQSQCEIMFKAEALRLDFEKIRSAILHTPTRIWTTELLQKYAIKMIETMIVPELRHTKQRITTRYIINLFGLLGINVAFADVMAHFSIGEASADIALADIEMIRDGDAHLRVAP